MKAYSCVAAILAAAAAPLAAQAPQPAPATTAAKFSLDTPIEEIVANPAARAVLDKHMPGMSTNDNYEMFKSMNLRMLSQMSDKLSPDMLAKVEADLAKVQ